MTAAALPALFDELSFGGEWRRYQKAAIAAFERDRAAGRRRTHIVAPPGSGKTLVGVELVRRVGRRELVSVADAPRYLVGRPLPDPSAGAPALLGRVLLRGPQFPVRHHPVPADLGRRKERAEAFARAWAHHLGPTRLVFTQRTDEGRQARAAAAAEDGGYETVVRDIWV